MNKLEQAYAGDTSIVIIETVEVASEAFERSFYLCNGFIEQKLYVDDVGDFVRFQPSNIKVVMPSRDTSGSQSVKLAISNIDGEAQAQIKNALRNKKKVYIKVRSYTADDKIHQKTNTLVATAKQVSSDWETCVIDAGYFNLLDTNFNRPTFNTDTSKCLTYYNL